MCTPTFPGALFTTARGRTQPRYPSADAWIEKARYTCCKILLSRKKEETLPFVTTWRDLEGTALSGRGQTEKEMLYDFT